MGAIGAGETLLVDFAETDHSAIIQDAEDALDTAGGGTLFFPAGTYLLSRPIVKRSKVSWFGAGARLTKFAPTTDFNGNQLLTLSSRVDVDIEGVGFEGGERESDTSGIAAFGSVSRLALRKCRFSGLNKSGTSATQGVAVLLTAPTDVTIEDCEADTVTRFVQANSGLIKRLRVVGNKVSNAYNNSIYLFASAEGSEDIWIEENHSSEQQSDQSPYYVTGAGTGTFERVFVRGNVAIGRDLAHSEGGNADLFSLKDIRDGVCSGNVAIDGGDLGFAIERWERGTVTGNVARRNDSVGIGIGPSKYLAVTGNGCFDNTQNRAGTLATSARPYGGIRIDVGADSDPSSHISVEGNVCTDTQETKTQGWGVVLLSDGQSHANISVGHNECDGNKYGPFYNDVVSGALREVLVSDIPTRGRFRAGDRFAYLAPAAESASGFICTTSGSAVEGAWASGETYEVGAWVTSASKVYVCDAAGGGTAANAPTHTSGLVTGADGYGWRFIATEGAAVFKDMAAIAA